MSKKIPLTQGKFAIVNDEDFEEVSKYKWHAIKSPCTYYAQTSVHLGKGKDNKYKIKNISMHRFILIPEQSEDVDHRDGNGLNNTRGNLRTCTNSQNHANMKPQRGGTSKYKGVCWYKTRGKWVTKIMFNYKNKTLGYYTNEIEAAKAYDQKAKELFGEFARTNFP